MCAAKAAGSPFTMKTESSLPEDIDAYIANFPRDVQAILQRIRRTIQAVAPEAKETIKYRIPTFVRKENLVHFAAFQKHIGFYPTSSGVSAFKGELAGYKSAKGSIQFPLDKPIPLDLIRRIAEFRVKEARERMAAKKR